jgi:hypothetical protein
VEKYEKSGLASSSMGELLRVEFRPIEAGPDVDEAELTRVGGLEDKTIDGYFWLNGWSAGPLAKFFGDCGIEDGAIERAVGCRIGVKAEHLKNAPGLKDWTSLKGTYPAPKPEPEKRPVDPVGLLPPRLRAERDFERRVRAYVLRHVHGLEDLGPIGKHLVEVGGVDPVAASEMLFDAFSEGRMWDALGSYGECL